MKYSRRLFLLPVLLQFASTAIGQSDDLDDSDGPIIEMSPFVVVTTDDRGYRSTNAVSGTSLNMKIRDLPMPVEIINREFIEDLQATNVKEALAYSAGVFTESFQSTSGANKSASAERSPSTVASVNNPFTNTVSIRGYAVPNQQRFGFRVGGIAVGEDFRVVIGGLTDSVNSQRLEVVRGPASLLYGVNVLSGVVNILPKRPLPEPRAEISIGAGSDGYMRGTLDVTGPIIPGRLHYRGMVAVEDRGSWTEFQEDEKRYFAGQLEYLMSPKIRFFLEAQYGTYRRNGIGSRFFTDSLGTPGVGTNPVNTIDFRTRYNEYVSFGKEDFRDFIDRDEADSDDVFLLSGTDRDLDDIKAGRGDAFRISGPDTYYERDEFNALFLVETEPLEGLNLELGGYFTKASEERFNVHTKVFTNEDRGTLFRPSDEVPIIPGPNRSNIWVRNPEVLALLGGSLPNLPLGTRSYGLDEIAGFSISPGDIPNFSTPQALKEITTAGLGEVFVVPDQIRRVQIPGTDWNTWNTKYARYFWSRRPTEAESIQLRARAAYQFESSFPFFPDETIRHTLIGGYQYTRDNLQIVSGTPPVGDIVTIGTLYPVEGQREPGLGGLGKDPYLLRNSVFDLTPIRYNGEPTVISGALNTSLARMGGPLVSYVEDGRMDAGEIPGWNIARSGWRDVDVMQGGLYGIYQGQFWNDKATFIAGIRRDSYQVKETEQLRLLAGIPSRDPALNNTLTDEYFGSARLTTLPYLIGDGSRPYTENQWITALPDALNREIQKEVDLFREGTGDQGTGRYLFSETQNFTSSMIGLSFRISKPLSLYFMYSEGVFPNQGQRDGLDRPIPAEQTSNKEIGFKFEFWDSKLSGTASLFQIKRSNATWNFSDAPSPRRWVGGSYGPSPELVANNPLLYSSFDARSAIYGDGPEAQKAYAAGVSAETYQRYSYGIHDSFFREAWRNHMGEEAPVTINPTILASFGIDFVLTNDMGVNGQFENLGKVVPYYYADPTRDFVEGKHINAQGVDVGLMMKEAFDLALADRKFDGWGIYYRDSSRTGPMGAGNDPSNVTGALVTFEEETMGFDGQIILSPIPNYQLLLTFSHQKREVVGNGFDLVPLIDPLSGEQIPGTKYDRWIFVLGEENFTDPTDPTTFTGAGVNGMDLSFVPKWNFALWNKYSFSADTLKGLEIAGGVRYYGASPTSTPVGGASLRANQFPTPPTSEHIVADASLSYRFEFWDVDWRVALKVDNLFNKTVSENTIAYENPLNPNDPELRRTRSIFAPRSFRISLIASY